MEIKNLTWLEKPLEKLIDATVSWIWALWNHFFELDSKKIKRIWKAEAEVSWLKIIEIAKAQNNVDLIRFEWMSEIEKLIYQKQISQETKRLKNIWDTLIWAKNILESWDNSNVSDEPVDEDWSTRFFNNVQDISNEQMKIIWSNLLAWEIKQPGTYSVRTLEVLKNLSKNEAELFQIAWSLSCIDQFIILIDKWINWLDKYWLNYWNITILRNAWLLSSWDHDWQEITADWKIPFLLKTNELILDLTEKKKIRFSILQFTSSWKELLKILNVSTNSEYIKDLSDYYTKQWY